jgi:ubiquinone/menaquinone biosynthesis C-methylase UbiE
MKKVFICPVCRSTIELPTCCKCGYTFTEKNNVLQLSDMPDFVISGDGDKYIGYEFIGENYSGNRKYIIDERDRLFSKEVSAITADGIFLDLACGDGCFTVPCAENGTRIIAGDISNKMLGILQEKAHHNHISLEKVTLSRMNALDVPLSDESTDCVAANSVLHLISTPDKVINEIYRVLKRGGAFVCEDDSPGKASASAIDNSQYNEIVNFLYNEYWKQLAEYGVLPRKFSWKFDRNAICESLFSDKKVKRIERRNNYEIPLKEGFLHRLLNRGFSDQMNVSKDLHDKVANDLLKQTQNMYGVNFAEIAFMGVEDDILITVYRK